MSVDAGLASSMQGVTAESGRGMGGAMKGGGQNEESAMNELYKVNQVYFRMLPTLSLVSKRTLLVNSPTKSTYTNVNETITFILNSGEFFASCPSSYLYIQVGYNDDTFYGAKALIPHGNILSLIEEVTFTSASGTELCRELNKGLQHAATYRYNYSQEYINTIGQVQGAPYGEYSRNHDGVAPVYLKFAGVDSSYLGAQFPWVGGVEGLVLPRTGPGAISEWGYACQNLNIYSQRVDLAASTQITDNTPVQAKKAFCVPMNMLLGLFNPYMQCLMPSGVLSGGRLDIRLKIPEEALQFAGGAVMSDTGNTANTQLANLIAGRGNKLTIDQIYLVFDAFQLQDAVLKRLNQVSAGSDGLSLLFDTYDATTFLFQGTGTCEIPVQQARSRIVRSYNIVRDNANVINPYIDSFASEPVIKRICGRIGPGAGLSTTNRPGEWKNDGGAATLASTGTGGGMNYVMYQKTPTNSTDPFDGYVTSVFPDRPALPNDDSAADGKLPSGASVWGQVMVNSYQAVLGALYFPQQPLQTAPEYYQNALYIWNRGVPDSTRTCSVTYEDFLGGQGKGIYSDNKGTPADPSAGDSYGTWVAPYGCAMYGMLAEKSQLLQLSGLPLSNARLLRHKFYFTFPTLSTLARRIDTFTQFTRVLKVFLGGRCIVRE